MKRLKDYSHMFALLKDWDKSKFKEELKKYNEQKKQIDIRMKDVSNYYNALSRNANYFEERIIELELLELQRNFELKPEHKIILQNIKIDKDGISGLRYLYDNFIEVVFKKNKYELSEKQQDDLSDELDKLIKEIPFAIKSLLK